MYWVTETKCIWFFVCFSFFLFGFHLKNNKNDWQYDLLHKCLRLSCVCESPFFASFFSLSSWNRLSVVREFVSVVFHETVKSVWPILHTIDETHWVSPHICINITDTVCDVMFDIYCQTKWNLIIITHLFSLLFLWRVCVCMYGVQRFDGMRKI